MHIKKGRNVLRVQGKQSGGVYPYTQANLSFVKDLQLSKVCRVTVSGITPENARDFYQSSLTFFVFKHFLFRSRRVSSYRIFFKRLVKEIES